ncbi:MAG: hypothetical protein JNM18_02480 [Planctomycetaceae bacterium]|nr:hypothetical protein [Planctomycetaceae bacterium]
MARLADVPTPTSPKEKRVPKPPPDPFALLPVTFQAHQVLVMMPFEGEEMDQTYAALKEVCASLGLVAGRADENVGSGFVIREIINMMSTAEFIIFDLTNERPNVYYELGFAHGIGNHAYNILLIARDGSKIHFDIAPLRVRYYRSPDHLKTIVTHNLKEMVRLTREQNAANAEP